MQGQKQPNHGQVIGTNPLVLFVAKLMRQLHAHGSKLRSALISTVGWTNPRSHTVEFSIYCTSHRSAHNSLKFVCSCIAGNTAFRVNGNWNSSWSVVLNLRNHAKPLRNFPSFCQTPFFSNI